MQAGLFPSALRYIRGDRRFITGIFLVDLKKDDYGNEASAAK